MEKPNNNRTEYHLKSAVEALTPNVLDRIDLTTPQERPAVYMHNHGRLRQMALVAATCLCVFVGGAGTLRYQYMNARVDTVIGIDVNPSVELSINRKERIVSAEPLNQDAEQILSEMNLKGVELNVAVNAVIGSMVTHGYLDHLDNAILVTVTNDSVSKARQLRASVVGDIEKTLEENQVQAVVYDQQVIEDDQIKTLAQEYAISYGKAYFLKELIDQNQTLELEDMKRLSTMTMEEIAQEISDNFLALGELADKVTETPTPSVESVTAEETTTEETMTEEETEETTAETDTAPSTDTAAPSTEAPTTEALEVIDGDGVEIDYVDYEDGAVYVYFVDPIKWKNPTVSVRDEEGNTYAAYVSETHSDECSIEVSGLKSGMEYTFVLGGLGMKGGDGYTTVTGYFQKPMIAWEEIEEETEEETGETVKNTTQESSEPEAESTTQTPETNESETNGTETSPPETAPEETVTETTYQGEGKDTDSEKEVLSSQETAAPETEPSPHI